MRITTRIALLEWTDSRITPANLAGAMQVPAPPQGERTHRSLLRQAYDRVHPTAKQNGTLSRWRMHRLPRRTGHARAWRRGGPPAGRHCRAGLHRRQLPNKADVLVAFLRDPPALVPATDGIVGSAVSSTA